MLQSCEKREAISGVHTANGAGHETRVRGASRELAVVLAYPVTYVSAASTG